MQLVRAEEPTIIAAMIAPYLQELVPGTLPEYPHFASYWSDPSRVPYVIRVGEANGGFALVRHHHDPPFHELAEFGVLPRFRRHGVGRAAARALFARHPGPWWLQVLDANRVARRFWLAVAPPPVHRTRRCSAAGRPYSVLQFIAGPRTG